MNPRVDRAEPIPRRAESIWRAPLIPIALAITLGIILDRYSAVAPVVSVCAAVLALGAWIIAGQNPNSRHAVAYLWLGCVALGAAYHHSRLYGVADNDIRHLASEEAKPARLRGVVDSEPTYVRGSGADALRSFPSVASTRFVLQVQQLRTAVDWIHVSGRAQISLPARIYPVHVGDSVEVVGRIALPRGPANPGEADFAGYLQDQGIGVVVSVPAASDSVMLLAKGWPSTLHGWLAVVRGWGQGVLAQNLSPDVAPVAGALLLGDDAGMTRDDWDKYARTGVIHVLAISGQHLVVLSWFLWLMLRVVGVSRRRGILFVAIFLILYALMAGGRPPAMRAAWTMAAYCGAVWLRRQALAANTFALAWIAVIIANPTDIFSLGCQLSFLAVAVLVWGTQACKLAVASLPLRFGRNTSVDPNLKQLIDESRPILEIYTIRLGRAIGEFYLLNALVWLAVAPLIASSQHMVTPVALLIGPPLVVLTSTALIAGFLTLLAAPVGLAIVFAWPVQWSLALSEKLVDWSVSFPGAYFYVPDLPGWWIVLFYLGLLAFMSVQTLQRRPLTVAACGTGWATLGSLLLLGIFRENEFRCTFLAIGHGGCTVIESADGRVHVYDAGAVGGPEVTRRQIAPYLWQRGISRIDDLMISHADLDHFNGVKALLERFSVGQVTLTPTFAERPTGAVQLTMSALHERGIRIRVVKAGDRIEDGSMKVTVLHPPAQGPEGNENARSMVLRVEQESLSILLTGDLEGPGLERVLLMKPMPLDVLMAPHHGSKTSNKSELAQWANPRLVISSQGPPRGSPSAMNPYEPKAAYLTTWKDGAVSIRKEGTSWFARSFRSKESIEVK